MKRLFFILSFGIFFSVGSLFSLGMPMTVNAVACPAGMVEDAGVCFPTTAATGLSSASVQSILTNFMFWLLLIIGMLAIIAFVISGMQYLASVGDAKLAETAKKNMINSIIGIVVALSGFVILQAINQLFTAQDKFF